MHNKPNGTRLAAYLRTSVIERDPERQAATIHAWAGANRLEPELYTDQGGRRHEADNSRRRPQYARLMNALERNQYDLLVVEEVSRLGFADEWALMALCARLRELGVELWEAKTNRHVNGTSISDFIVTGIQGHGSRTEVEQIATRNLGAKIQRAGKGDWQGGRIPVGMMVLCLTPPGGERWWVEYEARDTRAQHWPDGRCDYYRGPNNFPKKQPGDRLVLQPTRRFPERLEAVRQLFTWWITEHISHRELARRLQDLGVPPQNGPYWTGVAIARVLANPIYLGIQAYGKVYNNQYATIRDGVPVLSPKKGPGCKRKPRDQWIESPELFAPIIDRETWDAAQAKLQLLREQNPKAPRKPEMVYSGLVYCANCGSVLHGHSTPSRKPPLYYRCGRYTREGRKSEVCGPNTISQARLDELLDRWLEETGRTLELATREGEDGLLAACWDAGTREQLATVRRAMEDYLYEVLADVLPYEQAGDRRIFILEQPDEPPVSLALPSIPGDRASFSTVRELYDWAMACGGRATRQRAGELEAEHARLTAVWVELPTAMMREQVADQIKALEAELSRLRQGSEDLGGMARELLAELSGAHRRLRAARKALAGSDAARKAEALRKVLERIEVRFEKRPRTPKARQLTWQAVEIKFIPLAPLEESASSDDCKTLRSARTHGRWGSGCR